MSESNNKINKWPLIGNEHIIDHLEKLLQKEQLSGTYIFLGPENLGKTTLAYSLARNVLCEARQKGKDFPCGECVACSQMKGASVEEAQEGFEMVHGDLHVIRKEPDKKNISIEQIREFIKTLGMSSFLNSYKIGVIKNAEKLSTEASNALLKTLEEPRRKVIVVLIASDLESIPDTITSRSQVLKFYPVSTPALYDHLREKYNINRSTAKELSHLSLGRPALARKFLEDKEFYDEYLSRAKTFLSFFGSDINSRFNNVEAILGQGKAGQENARAALGVLECWIGIVRDLILLRSGNENYIQHEVLSDNLERIKDRFTYEEMVSMYEMLQRGKKEIEDNVNPTLVLENIATHIV